MEQPAVQPLHGLDLHRDGARHPGAGRLGHRGGGARLGHPKGGGGGEARTPGGAGNGQVTGETCTSTRLGLQSTTSQGLGAANFRLSTSVCSQFRLRMRRMRSLWRSPCVPPICSPEHRLGKWVSQRNFTQLIPPQWASRKGQKTKSSWIECSFFELNALFR